MQSMCEQCLWRMVQRVESDEDGEYYTTCMAFYPQPIPTDIFVGRVPHNIPLQGQTLPLVFKEKEVFK